VVPSGERNSKIWLILGFVAIALILAGFVAIARILLDRPSSEPAPVAQDDRTWAPANPEIRDRPSPIATPQATPKPQSKTPTPAPIPTPKATPSPVVETPTPATTPSPVVESPTPNDQPIEEQRPIDPPAPSPKPEQPVTGGQIPRVPGFAVGTPETKVVDALGEPTETQRKGYWPNTRTALYDLVPNQITLGYIYDRDSNQLVQTEGSFAQSVDDLVVRTALNGMLGGADRTTAPD
jgi:eukaryotic-like serine/threonine-protein kinase